MRERVTLGMAAKFSEISKGSLQSLNIGKHFFVGNISKSVNVKCLSDECNSAVALVQIFILFLTLI
jgi:hypothetical protein